MIARTKVEIVALVGPSERPGIIAAAEQLNELLCAVSGERFWPMALIFVPPGGQIETLATPTAVIMSLLPDAHRDDAPWADVDARWRACLEQAKSVGAPVFVCTVFRHISDRAKDGTISSLLERIQRLNRLAVDLSHDLDVTVIDIDRAFAYFGGRNLKTDYRLHGAVAAEVVGHTVVWSLLSFGLDAIIDPELQDKAKRLQGNVQQIRPLLSRRMERRRKMRSTAQQAAGG